MFNLYSFKDFRKVQMLKMNISGFFFLIISLAICTEQIKCVQATQQRYSLRKFAINFRETFKLNLMKNYMQKQIENERKRKKVEEERKKMEKIEALRRRVYQEYLLNQVTGKTTVLKDFFSRF
jgi:hypothetical protein